jgi:hypothetical protein
MSVPSLLDCADMQKKRDCLFRQSLFEYLENRTELFSIFFLFIF